MSIPIEKKAGDFPARFSNVDNDVEFVENRTALQAAAMRRASFEADSVFLESEVRDFGLGFVVAQNERPR
jgi:hypothetical protein